MTAPAADGIASVGAHGSVDETVERLKTLLSAKGVALFALVDHSGEAAKAGFEMAPTKLLIFGNPKAGTPIMLASPTSALDLPLKVLVWEDAEGQTWLTYNTAHYLQQRHGIAEEFAGVLGSAERLANAVAVAT